jgi:hypothetical protein
MSKKKNVRVDRIARRTKESLICWFCENCSEFLNGCLAIDQQQEQQQQQEKEGTKEEIETASSFTLEDSDIMQFFADDEGENDQEDHGKWYF